MFRLLSIVFAWSETQGFFSPFGSNMAAKLVLYKLLKAGHWGFLIINTLIKVMKLNISTIIFLQEVHFIKIVEQYQHEKKKYYDLVWQEMVAKFTDLDGLLQDVLQVKNLKTKLVNEKKLTSRGEYVE